MLRDKKAVIFDMDGTMIDSMWFWEELDQKYLEKMGIPYPCDLQDDMDGKSFHQLAIYFKERFHLTETVEEIMDEWNQMAWTFYTEQVCLKEGVRDFLQFCHAKGLKLGIATSNSHELADQILKVHHLDGYFSSVMTSGQVPKGKPEPDIYLAVANALKVSPQDCLVFEDMITGIMAAKAAGMTVCAVEDAYTATQRAQKQTLGDYYIDSFLELL
ncbi:MAG: HAD family phosphatase [Lachnospiraceae bacterium]|jgi:16S rRNA pseudouridine516 synthase|nr:HAD family phosphatase [Lachnospiraceae bacterium]